MVYVFMLCWSVVLVPHFRMQLDDWFFQMIIVLLLDSSRYYFSLQKCSYQSIFLEKLSKILDLFSFFHFLSFFIYNIDKVIYWERNIAVLDYCLVSMWLLQQRLLISITGVKISIFSIMVFCLASCYSHSFGLLRYDFVFVLFVVIMDAWFYVFVLFVVIIEA